jgi:hypothetical protein
VNEVHLIGQIKRVWTYSDNLYVRLSVRRAPGRPKRPSQEGGPYDYITILFPDGRRQLSFEPGQHLTVHGWIQSRDFDETLADFIKRAKGSENLALSSEQRRAAVVHRSVIEVVVERWRVLQSRD